MKNFIAELYMGNYHTDCLPKDEYTNERKETIDLCDTQYKQLSDNFTDEEKKLLSDLLLNEAALWSDEIDRAFARGVKIGMQLQTALDKIQL